MIEITYKINTSVELDILEHLEKCDNLFTPPLSARIEISEYSKKIFTYAERFEAWKGDKLIGLVAVYCNNIKDRKAYITNVSILEKYQGKGIANSLMFYCIEHIKNKNFKSIELEVNADNISANKLYKKFRFKNCNVENKMKLNLME